MPKSESYKRVRECGEVATLCGEKMPWTTVSAKSKQNCKAVQEKEMQSSATFAQVTQTSLLTAQECTFWKQKLRIRRMTVSFGTKR